MFAQLFVQIVCLILSILQEVKFAQMLKKVGREGLETLTVGEQEMKPFMSHYPIALQALKQRMSRTSAKHPHH